MIKAAFRRIVWVGSESLYNSGTMRDVGLFTIKIGLAKPWRVVKAEFLRGKPSLVILLECEIGSLLGCPLYGYKRRQG